MDVVPQTPKNINLDKTAPVNSPQQRKLANFDIIEEYCTGGYDSDRGLIPLFYTNGDEGEHYFDKDPSPVTQPVLV